MSQAKSLKIDFLSPRPLRRLRSLPPPRRQQHPELYCGGELEAEGLRPQAQEEVLPRLFIFYSFILRRPGGVPHRERALFKGEAGGLRAGGVWCGGGVGFYFGKLWCWRGVLSFCVENFSIYHQNIIISKRIRSHPTRSTKPGGWSSPSCIMASSASITLGWAWSFGFICGQKL